MFGMFGEIRIVMFQKNSRMHGILNRLLMSARYSQATRNVSVYMSGQLTTTNIFPMGRRDDAPFFNRGSYTWNTSMRFVQPFPSENTRCIFTCMGYRKSLHGKVSGSRVQEEH